MADPAFPPVAVRPASTLLLLAERPDLHVLMLKRNERSIFVGDMWVFPGGAVDPEDGSEAAYAAADGLTDVEASRTLEVATGGLAYWVAALRETFEEAGVLLARRGDEPAPLHMEEPDVAARFDDHRAAINTSGGEFLDLVEAEDLRLAVGELSYVSRWVTPDGAPRRYDTRFFTAAMPAGQVPSHDNDEAVHDEWVRPADALEANLTGEMLMVTPTVAMLQRLAEFGSVEEALVAAASGSSEDEEVIRIRPREEGPARLAFPAHADYATADERMEHGVVRWPRR